MIYIHFPYCLYKCHYCDFNSYKTSLGSIPHDDYGNAVLKEIKLRQNLFNSTGFHFLGRDVSLTSVFLGGGTPSLMRPGDVEKILDRIKKYFLTHSSNLEITLEANPKTIDREKLRHFRQAGINRLSLGVQSLHDAYLERFGRIHTADEARLAIRDIAGAGFRSWNIDLIFGFPGQTLKEWEEDLSEVISFNPPHLSCYSLTVEEGTPFVQQVEKKLIKPPDPDLQATMFEMTESVLEEAGYLHYETSNYSKPGFESQHNLNYWRYGEYVGLGAGGVSFLTDHRKENYGYRTTNSKLPSAYIHSVTESPFWFETEQIPKQTACSEFMMMGLRLKEGVSPSRFKKLFGKDLQDSFSLALAHCRQEELMTPAGFALTQKGSLFANRALLSFM